MMGKFVMMFCSTFGFNLVNPALAFLHELGVAGKDEVEAPAFGKGAEEGGATEVPESSRALQTSRRQLEEEFELGPYGAALRAGAATGPSDPLPDSAYHGNFFFTCTGL
jgi:hypothetical protein